MLRKVSLVAVEPVVAVLLLSLEVRKFDRPSFTACEIMSLKLSLGRSRYCLRCTVIQYRSVSGGNDPVNYVKVTLQNSLQRLPRYSVSTLSSRELEKTELPGLLDVQ